MFRSGASPCLRKLPLHSASHGQQVPEMVETWVMNDAYPLVNIQKAIEAMAIEIVDLYLHIPSGYVNIAIENGHRNSEFSHEKWWIFP